MECDETVLRTFLEMAEPVQGTSSASREPPKCFSCWQLRLAAIRCSGDDLAV